MQAARKGRTPATTFVPPNGLSTQMRVIGALIMREIHTRYGRENVGFLWMMIEPILFTFAVIALRSAIAPYHEAGTHGLSIVAFFITGYMPFLLFRHVVSRMINSIRANANLLYHRNIKLLDIYIARFLIELAGIAMAFAFSCSFFGLLGQMRAPADIGLLYLGWFYAAWFSLAFGLVVGPLSELSDVVDRLYQPVGYLLIVVSGCFYMADWLPPSFRDFVLAYNPWLHFFEMIRGGYFGETVDVYFSIPYITAVCAGTSLLGLLILPIVRQRITVE